MSHPKRQIVVAVDAGEPVQEAFKWALDNLLRADDHVTLINVRHKKTLAMPTVADQSASTGSEGDNDDGYNLGISLIMDEMVKQLHQHFEVPVDRVLKSGDPKLVLEDEVVIRDATALVMGSRGLDPVHRAFIGSVSDHCSRHADCAVIIVKKH